MHADRVEISWDTAKSNWLVRIISGEEVIRRRFNMPKDADEQALRSVVNKTVQEEGYTPDGAELSIRCQVDSFRAQKVGVAALRVRRRVS